MTYTDISSVRGTVVRDGGAYAIRTQVESLLPRTSSPSVNSFAKFRSCICRRSFASRADRTPLSTRPLSSGCTGVSGDNNFFVCSDCSL